MQASPILRVILISSVYLASIAIAAEDEMGQELRGPLINEEDLFGPDSEAPADTNAVVKRGSIQVGPGKLESDDGEEGNPALQQGQAARYEGPQWFSAPGRVFPLVLTGRDQSFRISGTPDRFVVFQYNANGDLTRYFVLEGLDPRRINEIRPDEYELVYVSFRRFVPLRMPNGSVQVYPLIRAAGNSTVFGVGGEAMYFK